MPRVETQMDNDNELSKMHDEIKGLKKQLSKKQNRRLFSCFNMFILFLLLILAGAIYLTYATAKTGLVEIPYVSGWVYSEPKPVYFVQKTQSPAADDFLGYISKLIGAQVKNIKNFPAKVSISLSENELTSFFNNLFIKDKTSKFDYVQAAITKDETELFVIYNDPRVFITIGIVPKITTDGKMDFEVTKIKIGQLQLSNFIGDAILSRVILSRLNQLKEIFYNDADITSFELLPGRIYLNLNVKKLPNVN